MKYFLGFDLTNNKIDDRRDKWLEIIKFVYILATWKNLFRVVLTFCPEDGNLN